MKVTFFFGVMLMSGCGLMSLGAPGTPSGGPYCFQEPSKPDACYQSESERAAGQSARQEAIRAEETRKGEAARATGEEPGLQRTARIEREQKAADAVERDRVFAERHAAEDAQKQADAASAAELHAMAQDPSVAVPAISAIICSIQDEMAGLKADLAHEKRVTAASGVVNLGARDEAGNDLVSDQEELSTWRAALKRYGAAALPCSEVASIVACRNQLDACSDAARAPAEVWSREQATLWGSERERPAR